MAFQYFDFECTWWRLFQKHVVWTKIYNLKIDKAIIDIDCKSYHSAWCLLECYWASVSMFIVSIILNMMPMPQLNLIHTLTCTYILTAICVASIKNSTLEKQKRWFRSEISIYMLQYSTSICRWNIKSDPMVPRVVWYRVHVLTWYFNQLLPS